MNDCFCVIPAYEPESVNSDYFILGFMQPQPPHQIFFLFYCEEMREPVLSVSACVEQDEQDNTTMAPFQIFDLSGVKMRRIKTLYLCPLDISSVMYWIRKKNNAD